MVQDNHSECKNAIIGLLDALYRVQQFADVESNTVDRRAAINEVAVEAIARHKPILERL